MPEREVLAAVSVEAAEMAIEAVVKAGDLAAEGTATEGNSSKNAPD
jgi:hypothetical protein